MRCLCVTLALLLTAPVQGLAQTSETGGFLLAYQPYPGEASRFEEGYRSHLEWHRERGDSLSWVGWSVIAGARLGAFVDGVFGITFAALDARVDPAGDDAHMTTRVLPYGQPLSRNLVRLRPALSTATPVEEENPTPLVQVTRYTVAPERVADVAAALEALRAEAEAAPYLPYTVYELGAGSEAGFLLMVWRDRLGSFDDDAADPDRALRRHLRRAAASAGAVTGLVQSMRNEVWRYRPDLTYLAEVEE